MKIKSIMAVALAATLTMAGCAKENGGNIDNVPGNEKVVIVKVAQVTDVTRAEANETGAATITLGAGYIFFTDSQGAIVRQVSILTSGAAGDDQTNLGDVTAATGATIKNVPSNSVRCYILSKATGVTVGNMVGQNISALEAKTVALADMVDAANNTVANVPLYGVGTVSAHGTLENTLATTVKIGAIGSRLQVKSIKGVNDIVSYQVDGIFVNNFFPTMPIGAGLDQVAISGITSSATLNKANVVNYVSDVAKYNNDVTGGYLTNYSMLREWNSTTGVGKAGATSLERIPVNASSYVSPVWAYNIFPNSGVPDVASPVAPATVDDDRIATFPVIVIRLSNVVWNDGTNNLPLADPQFLTVKGMKQGGTNLTEIKPRHVYTYNAIQFNRSNLTDQPMIESIDAEVKVELLQWIPETVDPEL